MVPSLLVLLFGAVAWALWYFEALRLLPLFVSGAGFAFFAAYGFIVPGSRSASFVFAMIAVIAFANSRRRLAEPQRPQ